MDKMRWIGKHRKILNILILLGCVGVFAYYAMRTINTTDVKVDTQVYSGSAMGTAIKKTIYSDNVAQSDEVNELIDDTLTELEAQISVRDVESPISKLNRNYAVGGLNQVPDEIIQYLQAEMKIYEETEGAFSPCIYPITSLWGIEDGLSEIPDAALLQGSVLSSDAKDLEITEQGVVFHESGMGVDLGAAGKGIACDVVKEKLLQTSIQGAVVSIGGSILAYGDKGDGKEWHIGIQDPRGETGNVLGVVDVEGNIVVSTSGDYEKYFELDGKRYHHIFDPITGYPVDNGLISVTVVCEDGLQSDALSTALFVMGLDKGISYAEGKGIGAIFVTSDMKVYTTKNMKKKFRMQSDAYELEKYKFDN